MRPRVVQSATCPVRELAIRELAYPRVVQLPNVADVGYMTATSNVKMNEEGSNQPRSQSVLQSQLTSSSAIAERPRDALSQLKFC